MTDETKAGVVGYKCPPKEHQFRAGESGNPSGKPKGARSFKSDLRDELSDLVTIREGNREIEISKQRALIKKLIAAAIAGEARAIATLVSLCVRDFDDGDGDDAAESPEDREILKTFARRGSKRRKNTATGI
jgi:hypothetical protein